jgi:hypothetical protein
MIFQTAWLDTFFGGLTILWAFTEVGVARADITGEIPGVIVCKNGCVFVDFEFVYSVPSDSLGILNIDTTIYFIGEAKLHSYGDVLVVIRFQDTASFVIKPCV